MNITDRNFDDLSTRFAKNIYGNAKGEIRLQIVWQHLMQTLPNIEAGQPLHILDAGCGFAQLSLKLAQMGHQLTLSDLSAKMLGQAEQSFHTNLPDNRAQFIHQPVQKITSNEVGQFDLILFHAVLEWLSEPQATLQHLLTLVKPGGHLSLMFYNKDALIYRNLIRGNWRKIESGKLQGDPGGLTPYHPFSLDEVAAWFEQWGMPIIGKAGVRVIYDNMERKLRDARDNETIIEIEQQFCQHPAYLRLGRYLHLVIEKPL